MIKQFFSSSSLGLSNGVAIIRVITGLLLIYHGWEVFDAAKMSEYAIWDQFKNSFSPTLMAYMGKGAELVAGLLLVLGLFTRLGAVLLIVTMLYITFFIGNGKFWYEDQHPFLFALLGLVFIFTGPGAFSLDKRLFDVK